MALSKRRHCLQEIGYGPSHGSPSRAPMQRPERYGRIRKRHVYVSSAAQAHEPRGAFDPPVLRSSRAGPTAITPRSGRGSHSALQSQPPSHPSRGGTMRARLVIPVLAAACVTLLSCDRVPTADRNPGRPSFITDGTLDGNAHPAVVLIIMDIAGKPAFRCSGTIIAPKLVLTAGHCAGEP